MRVKVIYSELQSIRGEILSLIEDLPTTLPAENRGRLEELRSRIHNLEIEFSGAPETLSFLVCELTEAVNVHREHGPDGLTDQYDRPYSDKSQWANLAVAQKSLKLAVAQDDKTVLLQKGQLWANFP